MRIAVLDKHQEESEQASRHISKCRAERFVMLELAKWVIVGKVLKMRKDSLEIRGDIRYFRSRATGIPQLRAPRGPEGLLIHYPIADQRS